MGTVAQNIARFERQADPDAVVKAARAADIHDLIVGLPKGYETEIGEHGAALSAGQRQRLALARALYGDPFLVVLDEPDSNLDGEGEQALRQAIAGVRRRGGIVVVVAHRTGVLANVDLLLAMQGRTAADDRSQGGRIAEAAAAGPANEPLRVISDTGRAKA